MNFLDWTAEMNPLSSVHAGWHLGAACLMLATSSATAGEQVALVMGNAAYEHGSPLANPVSDAQDIATALVRCGFELVGGGAQTDLTHEEVDERMAEFAAMAESAKVALVYFAGHGLEVDGMNYLVPVDAKVEEKYQVKHRTIPLDMLIEAMGGGDRLKIVVLDCCRNNPLGRGWGRETAAGLGIPKSTPGGTVLLYAAAPGRVAADGKGRNSPFTGVLKKAILTPGADIAEVFRNVGAEVKRRTGTQEPWMNSSYYGRFSFVPAIIRRPPPRSSPPAETMTSDLREPDNPWEQGRVGGVQSLALAAGAAMEFCWCPEGSFIMGSPPAELGRGADESQVPVRISRGFWMGRTEVTQGQWMAIMGKNPSQNQSSLDLPVDSVTWTEAQEFVNALNAMSVASAPWQVALPTEAQWEYACRAGTRSAFGFGDALNGMQANCDGNDPYGTSMQGPYIRRSAQVGSYRPNAWGIHDMHGNVWEWCADRYSTTLSGGTDPMGPASGDERVDRGGGWANSAVNCRSANRSSFRPQTRSKYLGLRLVVTRGS